MNKLLSRPFRNARRIHTSALRRDSDDTGPLLKKKRRFFDLKLFRQHLRRQKTEEIENEKREILKSCAKDPPENWNVKTFLTKIEIGENIDEIESAFKSWTDLITVTPKELYAMECLTNDQRRKIWKYVNQFNHGLYPEDSYDDFVRNFQAPPLENENKPWTKEDEEQFEFYLNYFDVNFGDPWLYISWKMKRTFDDVQNKYIELYLKKKNKNRKCEICLTKSTTPLLMNRKFKLDPPFLFFIPSSVNFPPMTIHDYCKKKESLSVSNHHLNSSDETPLRGSSSQKPLIEDDVLYPSYASFIFSPSYLRYVDKACF
ncbi:conserved Plasmodium protein, unknown function [Plasmodium knowlesi strain H]|uniref:Small ribosomal subunit protein mS41 SAM domain-containing protein n=3 Tax=Plasmodium knowlesi TaxID=5850 RepID=A0A5K1U1B1_PLAKH|nr:uncharacterized protein PKNH_1410200 [Plasmodium knowlesi strain H]OTN63693.1 Uncharacterized protein PKNOH_S140227300 [Plasmodium knowlesi]CAA9990701.1 conserved protein, unknown function [Plasmodium knowlesi strain H]SBO25900.1 conserved Plasmodium protein, unknown function [Plasmodium knowlesi strain H]SBO28657.1 conserved Plasmodium protein, unknown function [Plasmodium knowlesi strain H]VVS80175.1 conserved protein, unknown function [Plasmodium knowlesi strain H]|eukprot:XP_002261991.1 [Plasmodium knowlesi strain H]